MTAMTRRIALILRTVPLRDLLRDLAGAVALMALGYAGFFMAGVLQ